VALGLLIGWWLWPLRFADASPAYLGNDYRDDYILMIAEAYQAEGDLEAARTRLSTIDADDPAAPLVDLMGRLQEGGATGGAVGSIQELAADMGADGRSP
jgi:hypothetical protein